MQGGRSEDQLLEGAGRSTGTVVVLPALSVATMFPWIPAPIDEHDGVVTGCQSCVDETVRSSGEPRLIQVLFSDVDVQRHEARRERALLNSPRDCRIRRVRRHSRIVVDRSLERRQERPSGERAPWSVPSTSRRATKSSVVSGTAVACGFIELEAHQHLRRCPNTGIQHVRCLLLILVGWFLDRS